MAKAMGIADEITFDPHLLLDAGMFVSAFPAALDQSPSPPWLTALLSAGAEAPLRSDDAVRAAVRAPLRHGGFKRTGRS
jgi:hypothetical protein